LMFEAFLRQVVDGSTDAPLSGDASELVAVAQ
jgi:hypothetical protein